MMGGARRLVEPHEPIRKSPDAAPVHSASELESVAAALARGPSSGLVVMPDGFLNVHRAEIISLAARYHLPAVYPWRFFPDIGGLLSYGSEQRDLFRLAASYVDRILRGAKPSELPVQALVFYRSKMPHALGVWLPQSGTPCQPQTPHSPSPRRECRGEGW